MLVFSKRRQNCIHEDPTHYIIRDPLLQCCFLSHLYSNPILSLHNNYHKITMKLLIFTTRHKEWHHRHPDDDDHNVEPLSGIRQLNQARKSWTMLGRWRDFSHITNHDLSDSDMNIIFPSHIHSWSCELLWWRSDWHVSQSAVTLTNFNANHQRQKGSTTMPKKVVMSLIFLARLNGDQHQ